VRIVEGSFFRWTTVKCSERKGKGEGSEPVQVGAALNVKGHKAREARKHLSSAIYLPSKERRQSRRILDGNGTSLKELKPEDTRGAGRKGERIEAILS